MELAGKLEAPDTLREQLFQDLAESQEALGHTTARIAETIALLRDAAEREELLATESTERDQALEAPAAEIAGISEILAA